LKQDGLCVWLIADISTIVARMRNDRATTTQRPPLSDGGLERETSEILEAREPFYQEMADCIVSTTGKDIDAVADEVYGALDHHESYWNE
jgi:shikimate kinase